MKLLFRIFICQKVYTFQMRDTNNWSKYNWVQERITKTQIIESICVQYNWGNAIEEPHAWTLMSVKKENESGLLNHARIQSRWMESTPSFNLAVNLFTQTALQG